MIPSLWLPRAQGPGGYNLPSFASEFVLNCIFQASRRHS